MKRLEPLINRMSYDMLVERSEATWDSMTMITTEGTRLFLKYNGTELTINGKISELSDVPMNVKCLIIENSPSKEPAKGLNRIGETEV